MSEKYRIVIAEDSTFLREALKTLISRTADLDVVGEARNGYEAIQCVNGLRPHLILMDLLMPRMMGWDATREIKRRFPETRVLALTGHKDDDFVFACFRAGADGYLLKDSAHAELIEAIRNVLDGRPYIDSGISQKVIEGYMEGRQDSERDTSWESLSDRERQIVKLIGEGYTYKEIADYLDISPATVDRHRSNIGRKLNVHRRSLLVTIAFKKDLIVGQKASEKKEEHAADHQREKEESEI